MVQKIIRTLALLKYNQASLAYYILLEECELENTQEELKYVCMLFCIIELFEETEKYLRWLR